MPGPLASTIHSVKQNLLTVTALISLLLPAAGLACGEDLEALGYTPMYAKGRLVHVTKISKRQLVSATKVQQKVQLFGYLY